MGSFDTENIFSLEGCKTQVGGHTPFIHLDDEHLLKPCSLREIQFYEKMPIALKPIVPIVCVVFKNKTPQLTAVRCLNCSKTADKFQEIIKKIPPSVINSPILKEKQLSQHFLVVDDLTKGMSSMRIIDLKLGKRFYAIDATEEKIKRKIKKIQNTTSLICGIRLSGVLYREAKRDWKIGKNEGRAMKMEQLDTTLQLFFNVPLEVRKILSRKIEEMIRIIRKINGLRLFGASLLVTIDIEQLVCRVKLIDFANAAFTSQPEFCGPDIDAILGLNYILQILNA